MAEEHMLENGGTFDMPVGPVLRDIVETPPQIGVRSLGQMSFKNNTSEFKKSEPGPISVIACPSEKCR